MAEFNLEAIKKRRMELGFTMQEMAEKLGFANHSVYSRYERGEYKFNADVLPRLAAALNCNVRDFYV